MIQRVLTRLRIGVRSMRHLYTPPHARFNRKIKKEYRDRIYEVLIEYENIERYNDIKKEYKSPYF